MTKIKFCGLRLKNDVLLANAIKPDFAGFILSDRFWRFAEDFKLIRPMLDKNIMAVGVFVDNPPDEVIKYVKSGMIDYAQLHGREDEDYIKRVRDSGGRVIKAFKIETADDLERAYLSPADLVLLDSGTGTGISFDWSLIKNFGRDYILAGGLDPENAGEAVRRLRPYAVDVSSGIETDRVKDGDKMRKFAENVRNITI